MYSIDQIVVAISTPYSTTTQAIYDCRKALMYRGKSYILIIGLFPLFKYTFAQFSVLEDVLAFPQFDIELTDEQNGFNEIDFESPSKVVMMHSEYSYVCILPTQIPVPSKGIYDTKEEKHNEKLIK